MDSDAREIVYTKTRGEHIREMSACPLDDMGRWLVHERLDLITLDSGHLYREWVVSGTARRMDPNSFLAPVVANSPTNTSAESTNTSSWNLS